MLKRLMAVLALLVLVAVGCGGDDSSGGDEEAEDRSSEPAEDEDEDGPTEESYADEVSEICGEWFAEALEEDGSIRENVEAVAVTSEDLAADLEEVEAPEDLEDAVEELQDTLGSYTDYLSALGAQLAESEAQYGDSAEITGLGPADEEEVLAAREDLVEAFEAVDADCGFDEAESELAPFEGDSDDVSDDFSDDFSDDPSTTTLPVSDAQDPAEFITEYGTDPGFDALADSCFGGDYEACDELYRTTPVSESPNSYEGYGASCGGRRAEQGAGTCAETL